LIRAVAWDIDGTLVDSEPRHHRALLAASRALGVDLADLPDQAFRGIHMLDVWEALRDRYPPSVARDGWLDMINASYVADPEPLTPMPGAWQAIAEIHGHGLPQICVSNSNRAVVDANVASLGIGRFLAGSISLDDVAAGKPDPEPYRLACRQLGLDPRCVVAIEDSATGAISARQAGLRVVGFGEGVAATDVDALCLDLSHIPQIILDLPAVPTGIARGSHGISA
jgi:HAD superfamily hydrolase (TIGR01509 family)